MTDIIPRPVDYDRLDLSLRDPVGREAVEAFMRRLSAGSRRTMRQSLDWMAEEFSTGHKDAVTFPWHLLRYEHTARIRETLAERYAPATANKMLSALRGVLKECWRLEQMTVEELHRASDVPPVKESRAEPAGQLVSDASLWLVDIHLTNMRDKALLWTLVTCGLRREEAASLRWSDLDFKPNQITMTVHGKGNKIRIVPVPDNTAERLNRMMMTTPSKHVFGCSASRIWQILRAASFDAGVTPPVTPHDLRRTYASKLLGAGVDLPTVQRLMGHADPKTTSGYDRRDISGAAEAVQRVFG